MCCDVKPIAPTVYFAKRTTDWAKVEFRIAAATFGVNLSLGHRARAIGGARGHNPSTSLLNKMHLWHKNKIL